MNRYDYVKLRNLTDTIIGDFYSDESILRRCLLSDISSVRGAIENSVSYCDSHFIERFKQVVWREALHKINDKLDMYVLIDRFLYMEVLNNILMNVRHSFVDLNAKLTSLVSLNIFEETKSVIAHEVIVYGREIRSPPTKCSTLSHQMTSIEQYGGSLTISNLPMNLEKRGVVVRLNLLKRERPKDTGKYL